MASETITLVYEFDDTHRSDGTSKTNRYVVETSAQKCQHIETVVSKLVKVQVIKSIYK